MESEFSIGIDAVAKDGSIHGDQRQAHVSGAINSSSSSHLAGTHPSHMEAASTEAAAYYQLDHGSLLRAVQKRLSTNPFLLGKVGRMLAENVQEATEKAKFELTDGAVAEALTDVGYGTMDVLTAEQVADVHRYISDKLVVAPCNATNGRATPGRLEDFSDEPQVVHAFPDVLNAPHLLETALNPHVLGVVCDYLGCLPMVTDMSLSWTNPAGQIGPPNTSFRRESNDFRWVAMLVYLTDTNTGPGAQCFVRGSHQPVKYTELVNQRLAIPEFSALAQSAGIDLNQLPLSAWTCDDRFDTFYKRAFADLTDVIRVAAGTAVLEDSKGLHYGLAPEKHARLALRVVYGAYENTCYQKSTMRKVTPDVVTGRVSRDPMTRYVGQLLIDDSPPDAQTTGVATPSVTNRTPQTSSNHIHA